MSVLGVFKNWMVRRQYDAIRRHLRTAEPRAMMLDGESKALRAFQRAAATVPAYQRLLKRHGLDPSSVRTIEDFKNKVPIVDKEQIFAENDLRDLCVGGTLKGITSFHSSSGQTGRFSFGVETARNSRRSALAVEFGLDNSFHVLDRRSLLFNCLPMGVKIATRTVPVAETSVRTDVVLELVKELKDEFQQFIFVGEQLLLKRLFEQGAEQGIDWKSIVVHVATGAEYVAENYRSYLAGLLGIDFQRPELGIIGVNFGLSELSLSIMSEDLRTIAMRRLATRNAEFRHAVYGRRTQTCPSIMQYFPQQSYLETVEGADGKSELVVTMLDESRRLPLIRYNTRDWVELAGYEEVVDVLRQTGNESLIPPFRLPFGFAMGKRQSVEDGQGRAARPEHVKEALYCVPDVAARLTGNFLLQPGPPGVTVHLQARAGRHPRQQDRETIEAALLLYTQAKAQVRIVSFDQYPHGLVQDFERKAKYVGGEGLVLPDLSERDCPRRSWDDEPDPVSQEAPPAAHQEAT